MNLGKPTKKLVYDSVYKILSDLLSMTINKSTTNDYWMNTFNIVQKPIRKLLNITL